jgi:hypothetical protein
MANRFSALGAARFGQVAAVQGSGFLAVDSAMLVCDNKTVFGAIDLGYDIRARQPDPFVFIGADLSTASGTKQVYRFGQALGASKGGGVHGGLEMTRYRSVQRRYSANNSLRPREHTFTRYAPEGEPRLGQTKQGSWCVSIRKVDSRVKEK